MSDKIRSQDSGWEAIFKKYEIENHDFRKGPFHLSAEQIKIACQHLNRTTQKEVRILAWQISREMRPDIFQQLDLFILPVRNGAYVILKGEGYVDIPPIEEPAIAYDSQLDFHPVSSFVGDSEMQHLDYAYATGIVRDFVGDPSLVLTIRGRKYMPEFSFRVGQSNITAKAVQTEVDSGYEGHDRIVLVKVKNTKTANTIIRQLYYPYRQWKIQAKKDVSTLLFEKCKSGEYHFWEFIFEDEKDYNSIRLKKSARYKLQTR